MKSLKEFELDIIKYQLLSAHGLIELLSGMKYANGCGANGGIKFPKTMYGVNIESACIIHDIEWQLSSNLNDLIEANHRFNKNLKKICDSESSNKVMAWLRRMRIAKYVAGVELHGLDTYAMKRDFY